jgi:8-amino-7-oxononanoate synthase
MTSGIDRLATGLEEAQRRRLRRTRRVLQSAQGARVRIDGRDLVNFSSNDYLGLANHPALRAAAHAAIDAHGVGAGASPLVSGYHALHREAEERFAALAGVRRALLFPSGYAANLGILAALADRSAEIFGDKLNHACLIDGAVLSRATHTRYPHLDMAALSERLAASTAAVRIVATDTVFSMDGDVAPVAELVALCEARGAWLVLDDAHGIGVLGDGRGALAHFGVDSPSVVYMATLGKALGGYGAFVGGAPEVVDWLVQRARTYIYSTALPPLVAAAAIAAMDVVEGPGQPARVLADRIAGFRAACAQLGVTLMPSLTAIQPVAVGDPQRALDVSARLLEAGFLVPAIRPPTVPEGTSRLRVSLSAAHAAADVESLAAALARALAP